MCLTVFTSLVDKKLFALAVIFFLNNLVIDVLVAVT